ncbi:hypothetical protein E2K80_01090 [Rhodophyticola sp. CCM32]|uniref:hypothetical protein n=1 Tax=Rhodophyticola sp. CCM32 TaxID=2916397 RepID=UPI00107FAEAB|nr:hypothetical protein [Rhodophyticola sp. CCM32]QBX99492.1 hypothetical protein E2K80_01090 [Rhodophyticola sp. CCM32]
MRLDGIDLARFAAFAGMVLVNVRIAAQVTPGADIYSSLTSLLEGRRQGAPRLQHLPPGAAPTA